MKRDDPTRTRNGGSADDTPDLPTATDPTLTTHMTEATTTETDRTTATDDSSEDER